MDIMSQILRAIKLLIMDFINNKSIKMKPIIKITDVESGKELEIKPIENIFDYCEGCFYFEKCNGNLPFDGYLPCNGQQIIFKEVTKKKQKNETT